VATETLAILSGAALPARLAGGALGVGLGALLVNALRMSRHWRAAMPVPPAVGELGQGSRRAAKEIVDPTGRAERPVLANRPPERMAVGQVGICPE
jgi:hypothetical protein